MKKTTQFKKTMLFVLSFALIAALVLGLAGCGTQTEAPQGAPTGSPVVSDGTKAPEATNTPADAPENGSVLGEGSKTVTVVVVPKDGDRVEYTVKTDEKTVADALLAVSLIAGEDGAYGLYVKTVAGITADYDTDGTYWAFYIGDDYAMTGVSDTDIKDGAVYKFAQE